MTDAVRIIDARDGSAHPVLPIVEDEQGEAHAIVWPGIGAKDRSLHRIRLAPGARTVELAHPSEAVYYVVEGGGEVTEGDGSAGQPIELGSMVHTGPGDSYRLVAGSEGMVAVGGPCPADPALYDHIEKG
jgi:quercetin dioxygenase-like cupin family protein